MAEVEKRQQDDPVNDSGSNDHVAATLQDDDFGFTPEQQRRIIRRIDVRLVLTVGLLYCVCLNIANLVFFTTYTIFQAPSTILIRKIGPRVHLALITFFWGAVMIGMGFVEGFSQLVALRTVLGVMEAGLFPACTYLLSTWYTRYEVGKRYSLFYLLSCMASGVSGILAYGLMQLNGREGRSGWRWIFIIEGTLTCAIAIASYWLLVDFPDSKRQTWNFLAPKELDWVIHRIQHDRGDGIIPPFNLRKFLSAGKDWKIWIHAMILFNSTTITYSLAYTLPLILSRSLHFSIREAQCLVAPPYAFACIFMFCGASLGDKFRLRGPIVMANSALCLVGIPIMGWASTAGARYAGVFLVIAGASSNVPAVMAMQANNVRGQWKRAFCSAALVGFGGLGGIAGSLVFREEDAAGGYRPGLYAVIACAALNVVLVVCCDVALWRANRRADREGVLLEAHDDDASPDFRYTY
ncbi:putative phthalate transporter [Trichoderma gracile]